MKLSHLWRNCFTLLIPVLLVNAAFARYLPAAFQPDGGWNDIPLAVELPERAFRALAMLLPMLMPLSLASRRKRSGLWLVAAGTVAYCASWAAVILAPTSAWSRSAVGFLAPAWTPGLLFAGLAAIGDRFVLRCIPYRAGAYAGIAGVFLLFHLTHALIVWRRLVT